jgi:hypothetical protein
MVMIYRVLSRLQLCRALSLLHLAGASTNRRKGSSAIFAMAIVARLKVSALKPLFGLRKRS